MIYFTEIEVVSRCEVILHTWWGVRSVRMFAVGRGHGQPSNADVVYWSSEQGEVVSNDMDRRINRAVFLQIGKTAQTIKEVDDSPMENSVS